jgi:RNA-binding protein YlmH
MIASENDIGKRLDVFVAEYTNQTRNHVQAMIDAELVLVNGKKESKNSHIK